MEPVVLQAVLCDVLAGDDARHAVVPVQHNEVAQTHRAEESEPQLDCSNTKEEAKNTPVAALN